MRRERLLKQLWHLKKLKNIGFEYCEPFLITDNSDSSVKADSIEDVKKNALSCHLCSLSKTRKQVVFAKGNKNATLMIIGEAPGASEDEQGAPFVGRSGELLTNMIEKVLFIKREDVYITNVIKCRPPQNREPSEEEIEACRIFLDKEIELVKPKVILSLGNVSFRYLLKEEIGITKARGKVYQLNDIKVIPSFHPSYLLRNPSAKKEAYQDMLIVKELLS